METRIAVDDGAHLVCVHGDLDLLVAEQLRECIERACSAEDECGVVIDLAAVTFIDSSGLRELIRPAVDGCAVTLRNPSDKVLQVVDLAGVTDLFTVADA